MPLVPSAFPFAHATRGPITLSVNGGTGSDSPTGTRPLYILSGDHSSEPFETIQAALDSLPRILIHAVVINIAAGTYVGFVANGFTDTGGIPTLGDTNLQIKGVRGLMTLTTGSNQATGTSGTDRSVTVSGATWTVDELVGAYVEVTSGAGSGQILVVAKNTADTIYFATKPSPALASGSAFDITESEVVITSSLNNYAGGQIQSCVGRVEISDITVDGPTMGFSTYGSGYSDFRRCAAKNTYYGFHAQDTNRTSYREIAAINCTFGMWVLNVNDFANNNSGILTSGCATGFAWDGIITSRLKGVWVRDAATRAGWVVNTRFFSITDLMVDNCGEGVYGELVYLALFGAEINNCATHGLGIYNGELWISSYFSGSGNTGWAIDANGSNSTVMLANSVPVSIAASGGDITLDGTTDIGWANLTTAGQYALNEARGSRVNRQ